MSHTLLLAGLMWSIGAPIPKEAPKKGAPPAIVGTWVAEKLVASGTDRPAKAITFEFTSDKQLLIHYPGDGKPRENAYKVDFSKSPAELDWLLQGKERLKLRGIYKIDGKSLTLCVEDDFDGKRPEAFASESGSKTLIWTLKRIEKKKE